MNNSFSPEIIRAFLKDVETLLSLIRDVSQNPDVKMHQTISRILHSIKSGASFLEWDAFEKEAHLLEEKLKNDETSINWTDITKHLYSLLIECRDAALAAVNSEKLLKIEKESFTEEEQRILHNSMRRDEFLYRLTCRIDPSEPMLYPRASLIASRLEIETLLLKTLPSLNNPEADFNTIVFWFTTHLPEEIILKIININLVKITELVRLDYTDILNLNEKKPVPILSVEPKPVQNLNVEPKRSYPNLSLSRKNYEHLIDIAEEMVWRLEQQPEKEESHLALEIQQYIEKLDYQPLDSLMYNLKDSVEHLAERGGVKTSFIWKTNIKFLNPSLLENIGRVLIQLIKNSISHGIEPEEERSKSGKNSTGVIEFRLIEENGIYRFEYRDDGRGINEQSLRKEAENAGIECADKSELLDILCVPEFSTVDSADADSGRGLGMDLVRRLVQKEFGDNLILENHFQEGVRFYWNTHYRESYLLLRTDNRKWAIPSRSVVHQSATDSAFVDASGQNYKSRGTSIPIVGEKDIRPFLIEIQHRDLRAVMFFDEILSEEFWGADNLVSAVPSEPWCRSFKEATEGISIISSAIVTFASKPPSHS